MPTYDLVCNACGHKFSVFCSISKKDEQVCPECGSAKVSQRFTAVNIGGSSSLSTGLGTSSCGSSGFS